jgi:Uma2 family endonuclease
MNQTVARTKRRRQRPLPPAHPPAVTMFRFSVEDYHRLIEIGVLTENDRVELLEGWLVAKMPQNPPHAAAIGRLYDLLRGAVAADWVVRCQLPLTLSDSEPEPDFAVARGPATRYDSAHPKPADVSLVVEIADTTLAEDRGQKSRLYARARVPVYWIVNRNAGVVEVYTQPRAGKSPAFREWQEFARGTVVPVVLAGRQVGAIAVRDLIP